MCVCRKERAGGNQGWRSAGKVLIEKSNYSPQTFLELRALRQESMKRWGSGTECVRSVNVLPSNLPRRSVGKCQKKKRSCRSKRVCDCGCAKDSKKEKTFLPSQMRYKKQLFPGMWNVYVCTRDT